MILYRYQGQVLHQARREEDQGRGRRLPPRRLRKAHPAIITADIVSLRLLLLLGGGFLRGRFRCVAAEGQGGLVRVANTAVLLHGRRGGVITPPANRKRGGSSRWGGNAGGRASRHDVAAVLVGAIGVCVHGGGHDVQGKKRGLNGGKEAGDRSTEWKGNGTKREQKKT